MKSSLVARVEVLEQGRAGQACGVLAAPATRLATRGQWIFELTLLQQIRQRLRHSRKAVDEPAVVADHGDEGAYP